jgi:hypothetical protein
METQFVLVAYYVYLPVTILLTLYVAHVLFKQGRIFMLDIFKGRTEIADATNHLFKVGFYLLNIGFALMMMETRQEILSSQALVEVLSNKIGWFSVYLGIMLFFNLYLFFRGKKKSSQTTQLA